MATQKEIQDMAAKVFAANGWIDDADSVIDAVNYDLFQAFTERMKKSKAVTDLKEKDFDNYLFLMARDYLSVGYASVWQQTWSHTPYCELGKERIDSLLDEIWEVGAFDYAIGPMGPSAQATTQDICLMAQTFANKFIGEEQLKEENTLTYYKKAFYNIGITLGYKFCGDHL